MPTLDLALRHRVIGCATGYAGDQPISGYINDERLYVTDAEFHIERAGSGFNTVEMGNHSNQVHYERP